MKTLAPINGQVIRYNRIKAGLKQYELAQRLGIAPTLMSRIEHGLEALPEAAVDKCAEMLGFEGVAFGTIAPGKWFIRGGGI